MLRRIEALLTRPRATYGLGLLVFVLCAPALQFGLQADDHLLAFRLSQGRPPWALFGLPPDLPAMRELGALLWWSNPDLEGTFFRPLTSLSHALEFHLWPHAPWLMRLLNIALYSATVVLAAHLYRRLSPSWAIAALAALLFAIDHTHVVTVDLEDSAPAGES